MNYMSEVAKMLGVELGESFYISTNGNIEYVFTANGLFPVNGSVVCNNTLNELLSGTAYIKRKPWKPNRNEIYWVIDERELPAYDEWMNTSTDLNYYKLGNCYKTKEEAERNVQKWIDFYSSDEVLEV
jgi:hypothetical protein